MNPRIYVASLTDYNAGRLVGEWIDCDVASVDELEDQISAMLEAAQLAHPEDGPYEEWAIHDSEDFGTCLGEHDSLQFIADLGLLISVNGEAVIVWAENDDYTYHVNLEAAFDEAYLGEFEDIAEYVGTLVDDGVIDLGPEDSIGRQYFDYESFGRDLEFGGDVWSGRRNGNFYLFNS